MDFPIRLDQGAPLPLHQQLYEELRHAILDGRLLPHQRIPSTRSLAKMLGISRTTVMQSYERLLSEGYLETLRGSGTYICAQLPDDWLRSDPVQSASQSNCSPIQLSQYGTRLSQSCFTLLSEPDVSINFRYGRPALSHFPLKRWRKLLSRHSRYLDWLDYATDFQGCLSLREAIARYLSRARAVRCSAEQIVVTNGTQQALDLLLRVLLNPGDRIAIEEPGYLSARRIFLSHGARLVPVAVDESGLMVERLAHLTNAPIRLIYVTPSHQFPTGALLSLPRRLELLAWAQQTNTLILEDDYDSEYRYGDRPIPALQGLDAGDSVIYMATFSKVLFPALRIGYVVLPYSLVSIFAEAKWLSDRQLPMLEQRVLADFIEEGYFESHIRQMRSHYDQNCQALVKALKHGFGEQVTILGEKAGIHLMVRFHTSLEDAEIIDRAGQVGVGLMSAQPHYLNPINSGEFILGYGELNIEQIQEGIRKLVAVIR